MVWLDELQNFLTDAGIEAVRGIRRLLTNPRTPPILFIGTVWPETLAALEVRPTAEQARRGRGEFDALLAETKADRIHVPDAFTADDLETASDDARVQTAIRYAIDGQVTQVLAGGSQLVDRAYGVSKSGAYSPAARAVILAAADLRRVGHPDPLPQWAILGAASGYLDPFEARWQSLNWAQEALEELIDEAKAQRSGQRDLHQNGVPALRPANQVGHVELHDYLLQHHLQIHRHHPTTQQLWSTLTDADNLVRVSEHAFALALDAESRGLRQESSALLSVAEVGDPSAKTWLVSVLARRGDAAALAALRTRADDGDDFARLRLVGKIARPSAVIVCVLFGLVLGATPIGDGVNDALTSVGNWVWQQLVSL